MFSDVVCACMPVSCSTMVLDVLVPDDADQTCVARNTSPRLYHLECRFPACLCKFWLKCLNLDIVAIKMFVLYMYSNCDCLCSVSSQQYKVVWVRRGVKRSLRDAHWTWPDQRSASLPGNHRTAWASVASHCSRLKLRSMLRVYMYTYAYKHVHV